MTDTSLRATPVGALAHLWHWQLRAACRGQPELFFHPPGERDPRWTQREAAAKRVCAACPVRRECAAFALASEEPYGTWGGVTAREREQAIRGAAARRRGPVTGPDPVARRA